MSVVCDETIWQLRTRLAPGVLERMIRYTSHMLASRSPHAVCCCCGGHRSPTSSESYLPPLLTAIHLRQKPHPVHMGLAYHQFSLICVWNKTIKMSLNINHKTQCIIITTRFLIMLLRFYQFTYNTLTKIYKLYEVTFNVL